MFCREGASVTRINVQCEKRNQCNRDLEVSWAIYNRELIFLVTLSKTKLHSHAWCDTFQFLPNSLCSHLRAKLSIRVCICVTETEWVCVDRRGLRGRYICLDAPTGSKAYVCVYVSVWECMLWACVGLFGSKWIKAAGSQLATGLICSRVAVNYSQCQAGWRGGV